MQQQTQLIPESQNSQPEHQEQKSSSNTNDRLNAELTARLQQQQDADGDQEMNDDFTNRHGFTSLKDYDDHILALDSHIDSIEGIVNNCERCRAQLYPHE